MKDLKFKNALDLDSMIRKQLSINND